MASSIRSILKDEHEIIAYSLFPVVSPLFLAIGLISMYHGDTENAKMGLEAGGGTAGYSILSKIYSTLSK